MSIGTVIYLSRNKYRNSNKSAAAIEEVTIERLGAQGDGIGLLPSGITVYVPYTAPGDRVRILLGPKRGDGRTATIEQILETAPVRIDPECQHFGDCGGCALQHLPRPANAKFKSNQLRNALQRRGFSKITINPTITIPPGHRRRVEFAIGLGKRPTLGLHRIRSKEIINIDTCPAIRPALSALLPALRVLLKSTGLARHAHDIRMTETQSGLDLLFLSSTMFSPDLIVRQKLAVFAEAHNVARISWSDREGGEPLVQRRAPNMKFGLATVSLPIKYFLQPSTEGEIIISNFALNAVGDAKRVADLYAGCGSLSFPMTETANVTAFELINDMVAAMQHAAAGLSFKAEQRDLARSPLTEQELNRFDAVVFDPPRAGAKDQAEYLALSKVPKIVAVSCNPTTLARDLRALVDGGYVIDQITPIDQFAWSAELETIAVLSRDKLKASSQSGIQRSQNRRGATHH
jgi:23S rRNA (uracil1939-C5)-methyltransferase